MTLDVDIEIEAEGWSGVPDLEALARRAAEAALAAGGGVGGAVAATLLFTGDDEVEDLNREWRGLSKPTNVLSFPASIPSRPGEPRLLGDVALAYETVAREAAEQGKSVADHTAHLVVHGMLHLLGRDHEDDAEADAMERTEVQALSAIGVADPYRDLPA